MGNMPKRKKLDRSPEVITEETKARFFCCRCGKAYCRQKGFFPVSHSPMYRGTGYFPICNDCIDELYNDYKFRYNDDCTAMKRICMKLDIYWNEKIYSSAEKTAGTQSRIRKYFSLINVIKYMDKTYDDTLEEEYEASRAVGASPAPEVLPVNPDWNPDAAEEVREVPREVIDFWGEGFAPETYEDLEKRYREWTEGMENVEHNKKVLYKQLCMLDRNIQIGATKGKVSKDDIKAFNDLLGSMGLKPVQQADSPDEELEKMPLGVGLQFWEEKRPLPPTPEELKDVNHNIKNITIWFLGHLCKMCGIRNGYVKLYDEAMEELRIKRPDLSDEDDDSFLYDIFSSGGGDTHGE